MKETSPTAGKNPAGYETEHRRPREEIAPQATRANTAAATRGNRTAGHVSTAPPPA
jgi:hypothetical protein